MSWIKSAGGSWQDQGKGWGSVKDSSSGSGSSWGSVKGEGWSNKGNGWQSVKGSKTKGNGWG